MTFLYWFFKTAIFIFLKIFNRFEVIGAENVPKKGGVLLAANHVSYLDPPVVGAALRRQATFMAREGLFKIPLLGSFIRSFSLPIRRGKPQPSMIKEAVNRLKKGELIVIFPEGSRSSNGSILDAKRGIGMLALISRAPIVPAYIYGTEKALPVGAKVLRPAKITVIFGKPIEIKDEKGDRLFQDKIGKDIMGKIRNLKKSVIK